MEFVGCLLASCIASLHLDCTLLASFEGLWEIVIVSSICLHSKPPSWVAGLLESLEGPGKFVGVSSNYLHIKSVS